MMTPAEFRAFMAQRTFYHFTDVRNLDSIRAHDGLLSVKELQRLQIIVAAPGGNSWSRQADASASVDDFVHLCFCDEHPMEYEARRRGDIGATQFLRIKPEVLEIPGVCVTLEVSNKSGSKQVSLDDACKVLDFEVIYERTNWRDPVVMDRLQRARKCELLVPKKVPLALIANV